MLIGVNSLITFNVFMTQQTYFFFKRMKVIIVIIMAQQNRETQQSYDELEQYGRRLWLRNDSVPKQNNEKTEEVFRFVKGLIEKVPDLEIPEVVVDRAHRIGPDYTNNKKRRKCVSQLLFVYDVPSLYNILQSSKVYSKQSTG